MNGKDRFIGKYAALRISLWEHAAAISILSAFFFVYLGFYLYWTDRSFGSRLSLTAAGSFASIWITLWIIQRVLKENERKKWADIEAGTYEEIKYFLRDIAASTHISIVALLTAEEDDQIKGIGDRIRDNERDGKKVAEDIADLRNLMVGVHIRVYGNLEEISEAQVKHYVEMSELFYDNIKFSLEMFRIVLLPRVIEFSNNRELLAALMNFEIKSLKYEGYMRSCKDPLCAIKPGLYILPSLIDVIENAANVYWFIAIDIEKR